MQSRIIREANKLASQEYVQIFNDEFEKRKEFYNKQIELNLEAIEFFEENFSKETELVILNLQETPIFDDIVKTGYCGPQVQKRDYKYNVKTCVEK